MAPSEAASMVERDRGIWRSEGGFGGGERGRNLGGEREGMWYSY